MTLTAPGKEDWIRRSAMVESYQRAWLSEALKAEDLYELRWTMDGIPDNVPLTIPSTARAIVDEATDHSDFDPRWLRVHTPTYGMTEDAAGRSSLLRAFLPGWLYYQITHTNDVSPLRDYLKNMYLYGKAVWKVYYDKTEWPQPDFVDGMTVGDVEEANERVKADREFVMPVIMRSIHPMALREDPAPGRKKWGIEVYERSPLSIRALYEDWMPEGLEEETMEDPNAMVELWDCYQIGEENGEQGIYHQVLVNERTGAYSEATQRVFLPGEPYPYIVKYSGFGRQSGRYEEMARGLLYSVDSLLRAEGRRQTQLDAIVSAMAWPTIFVTGPRTVFKVEYGPNVVNYVPSGVQVSTVTPPIPAGPIQTSLAMIQQGIERGTFGSVIRGEKPPQTTSAAQLAILSGQARLRFGSIKIHVEASLLEAFQKAMYIIKYAVKDPVTLWQWDDTDASEPSKLVIKPSDIPFPLVAHIEVLSDPTEEQERRAQFATFLLEKNIIDWEEAAERSGVRDVKAMRRRMIRDKVLFQSPAVIQALGEQYLLESGYDIESLQLEKAMRDLFILRSQRQMQEAIMSAPGGAASSPGSTPAPNQGFSPNQLGGRPGATPVAGANPALEVPSAQ